MPRRGWALWSFLGNDLLTMLVQTGRKPNYIRPKVTGATIFFTVALAESGSDLLLRQVDRLCEAVRLTKVERPFAIGAMVVLPDHLHAVWTLPSGDADFSVRWGAIKGRFSQSLGRAGFSPPLAEGGGVNPALRRKGKAGIWQRRFWKHRIRSEADLAMHLRYCWQDPVRHGLVARAEDWSCSSIHREMRAGRVGERRSVVAVRMAG